MSFDGWAKAVMFNAILLVPNMVVVPMEKEFKNPALTVGQDLRRVCGNYVISGKD